MLVVFLFLAVWPHFGVSQIVCNYFQTTSPFLDSANINASGSFLTTVTNGCSIFDERLCVPLNRDASAINADFWDNLPINSSAQINCDCAIDPFRLDLFFSMLQNSTLQFAASGCSYFSGSVYTGIDACAIQPLLVNEFGQTLFLSGYNLSLYGFYEFYSQIAYPAWATRFDTCLVVPIYSTRKPKIFTQNIFASDGGARLQPSRACSVWLVCLVVAFLATLLQ